MTRDTGDDRDDLAAGRAEQETMAFLLRLRTRGIADVGVLRALETVPRPAFAPHRYADLALRDIALPIPCGQTMSEPFALAQILESMKLEKQHRVLEIGTGSGYGAALMAKLAGEVLTIERFRTLSLEARLRLKMLEVANVVTIWGDGLDLPADLGLFDRILVDGSLDVPQIAKLLQFLAEGGAFIGSIRSSEGDASDLLRISHRPDGFVHARLGPSLAAPLIAGTSHAL
jgi:protein-L-isoaspartate(D-aspartate) O-methyltransferase